MCEKPHVHWREVSVQGAISKYQVKGMIGESPAMQQVYRMIQKATRGDLTVAIQGESGTGKSTIAHLLLRLFDPDDGSVSLDERDLRTVTLGGLRQSVAFVDQEPSLFHTNVRENITYGCPAAPMSSVEAAAAAAGIHDFISSLPQGYETVIGERGTALSVGERQRLAIARALLMEPSVLVLDELTASLDPATERHVLDGYARIMGERTTIVISHRLELAHHYRNGICAPPFFLKDESRIESLRKSVVILEKLVEQFPDKPSYVFELADTLAMSCRELDHNDRISIVHLVAEQRWGCIHCVADNFGKPEYLLRVRANLDVEKARKYA